MKKEKNPFRKSKHSLLFLLYLFSFFRPRRVSFTESLRQSHVVFRGQSKRLGREDFARKMKKGRKIHVFIGVGFNYQALARWLHPNRSETLHLGFGDSGALVDVKRANGKPITLSV